MPGGKLYLFRKLFRELVIGFGDPHDLQVRPVAENWSKNPKAWPCASPARATRSGASFRLHLRLCLRARKSALVQTNRAKIVKKKLGKTISFAYSSPNLSPYAFRKVAAWLRRLGAQSNQKIDRTRK